MLYLFSHSTLPWVKFGFTRGDAWRRLPFWSNQHPRQLCGRLGAEHFTLLRLWEGDLQVEVRDDTCWVETKRDFKSQISQAVSEKLVRTHGP